MRFEVFMVVKTQWCHHPEELESLYVHTFSCCWRTSFVNIILLKSVC